MGRSILFNKLFNKFKKKSYRTAEVENIYGITAAWNDWIAEKAISEGYKSSVWVYACVKKRADSLASVPLLVRSKSTGDLIPNHPLQILLDSPNPNMSQADFVRWMVTHLDLAGNSYWGKVRDGRGVPLELWTYSPDYIQVVPGQSDLIAHYIHTQTGNKYIEYQDMCHFAYIDPSSMYYGMSPLKAAGKAVDVDNSAQDWQKISMQNRGVPDGVFSFDGNLTAEQYKEARKQVREQHAQLGQARAPWVLSKATYTQLSQNAIEMDFMATRDFTKEEICSVYGVPSSLIAKMGDVNLANAETARRAFWQDTLQPLLEQIEGTLNSCLASEFGPDVEIYFDTSNVAALQQSQKEKLENAKFLWSMGVPFNTINEHFDLGLDDIDGGDIGYIPTGVIPTSFDFSTDEQEPEASTSTEEAEKAFAEAYGKGRD